MHDVSQQHTDGAGKHAHQGEFESVTRRDGALAQAQHPQHGAIVEVAGRKGTRRQGHRHGTEQCRQQSHQTEKFFCAVQRLAHLGSTTLERLHAHPTHCPCLDLGIGPIHKHLHRRVGTCDSHAVVDATGRLNQLGSRYVGLVDHHAWSKIHETRAPVWLHHNDRSDLQRTLAQQKGVPQLQAQRLQEWRINPGLTGAGHIAGGSLCSVWISTDQQGATQRIALFNGLERHEFGGPALCFRSPGHRRKTQGGIHHQTQRTCLVQNDLRGGVVARHHGIAAQELPGIALQPALEPVCKKSYGSQCGHSQHHRHHDQTQIPGAQITPQCSPTQTPKRKIHPLTLAHLGRVLPAGPDRTQPAAGIQATTRKCVPASSGCNTSR